MDPVPENTQAAKKQVCVKPFLSRISLICINLPGPQLNLEGPYKKHQSAELQEPEGDHTLLRSSFKDLPPHQLSIQTYSGPLIKMHQRPTLLHAIITTYERSGRRPRIRKGHLLKPPGSDDDDVCKATQHPTPPEFTRTGLHASRPELPGKNPSWCIGGKNNQSISKLQRNKSNHNGTRVPLHSPKVTGRVRLPASEQRAAIRERGVSGAGRCEEGSGPPQRCKRLHTRSFTSFQTVHKPPAGAAAAQ